MNEQSQPRPYDAVLGGNNPQPKPTDAVLGGQPLNRELTDEERLKLNFMLDPKLEPQVAHALASLVSAVAIYGAEGGDAMIEES